MGGYFLLFLAAFTTAVLSLITKHDKSYSRLVFAIYVIMTAMLCFRFGQGTDYYVHSSMFYGTQTFEEVFTYYHGERLFLFICFLCNKFMNFKYMVMIVSFLQMILMWKFMRRYSKNIAVSMMIMFMVYYIVYLSSAFRQGIVTTVFFGIGTSLIEKRKWLSYILLFIVLSGIHTVSLIYLLVPLALLFSVKTWLYIIFYSLVFGLTVFNIFLRALVRYDSGVTFNSVAERLLTFIVIYYTYHMAYKGKGQHWWMKFYCLGIALFCLIIPSINSGRRITGCFKAIEIIIFPCLMTRKTRYRQLFVCYVFALAAALSWNSIKAEIDCGGYDTRALTPVNYPYVSIFNAKDIHNYRKSVPILPDEQ